MKQGTKQRIVGSVVVLALAIIFLPIVFDGQGSYQIQTPNRIPAQPLVPILPEPQQSRPVIISDAAKAPTVIEIEPAVQTSEESTEGVAEVSIPKSDFTLDIPGLDAVGLPQSWSVRLGSFSDTSNGENLLQRLQNAGYKAYTRNIGEGQEELLGVFVGPWVERALADEHLTQLQDQFQLVGMVVRYEVKQL